MPTIISHALVPLAAAMALGGHRVTPAIAFTGAIFAMLPDADVIGFKLGIAYADSFGHRGASHSLFAAAAVAGLATLAIQPAKRAVTFAFLFFAMASHGLLDTLTNGGLGAALLWPLLDVRIHAPVTPIMVSPIGVGFFSTKGVAVLMSEACWIWLPCLALVLAGFTRRRLASPPP
jgi:inner membrane protein